MRKGRIVVFGDTSSFTNGILFGSHAYVAGLFASLTGDVAFGPLRVVLLAIGLGLLG